MAITLRRAEPADVPGIKALVAAAYGHYVARIGRKPGPMADDYAARVAAGEASLALDLAGAIVGLLVLQMRDGAAPCSTTSPWPRARKARASAAR
jgi:hypothetical protein